MSLFVQQNHSCCDFSSNESWIILSAIEQSIKRKIEAVGIPLKEWNIKINYGIKTGFNDAFIISTEKREEILSNCIDEDERERTAAIIRPILRGRDIKRYGYNWADLWLINTHNGVKGAIPRIDVNDYPAIKQHLDCYWDSIAVRADKGDTPYNLRNCAYLEDFNKPKIVYREIGTDMDACLLSEEFVVNNKLYILTGNHLEYLITFFNSRVFNKILMKAANITGGKGADFMYNVPVPMPSQSILQAISATDFACNMEAQKHVDVLFFELLGLSEQERSWISSE